MKSLFLLFFFVTIGFSYDLGNSCCFSGEDSSGEVNSTYVTTSLQKHIYLYSDSAVTEPEVQGSCIGHGKLDDTSHQYAGVVDGTRSGDYGDWYTYHSIRNYICSCSLPDIPLNETNLTGWFHVASWSDTDLDNGFKPPEQCYEADGVTWKTFNGRIDCKSYSSCYTKKPPYSCSTYGNGWSADETSLSTVITPDSCSKKVDGVNYDSSHFNSTSDWSYTPTCCLHSKNPKFDCTTKGYGWHESYFGDDMPCDAWVDGIDSDASELIQGTNFDDTCCTHNVNPSSLRDTNDTNNSSSVPDLNTTNGGNVQAHADAKVAHADAKGIKEAVQGQTSTIHSDITTSSNQSHSDNQVLNMNITNSSNQSHSDSGELQADINDFSAQNHSDLEDIKDLLSGDSNSSNTDTSGVSDSLNNSLNNANNVHETLIGNFANLSGAITGNPPIFIGTGSCSASFNVFGKTVTLDYSFISALSSVLSVFWSILLVTLNFKIYTRIFMFFAYVGL